MRWTDDPVMDQMRHDAEQEARECLHCSICDGAIYEGDEYYEIDDMEICPECLRLNYRRLA